jgi:V8-like Glu-specific endopeptidase
MGFHIIAADGDRQLLTAGHCSVGGTGSKHWYHRGATLPYVGYEIATMYNSTHQRDIARVTVSDSWTGNLVYRTRPGSPYDPIAPYQVSGVGVANAGATICASLGQTNWNQCGWISERWSSWQSSGCNCIVWGGRMDGIYDAQAGDSGSPLYAIVLTGAVVAYGVLIGFDRFTWVKHGLDHWGASLLTS